MVFACGWLSACTPVTSVSPEHTQINIARTQSLANTFPGRCSFEQRIEDWFFAHLPIEAGM